MEKPLKMDDLGVPLFSIGVIITYHIIGIFHNPGDFQGIGDQKLPQLYGDDDKPIIRISI